MRLFIAIPLDLEIKKYLESLQVSIKEEFWHAKNVKSDMMHCTLIYFGDKRNDELDIIDEIISSITFKEITLELDQLGIFKKNKGNICYCGLKENRELFALHKELKECLLSQGITFDNQAFNPHITLARNAKLNIKQNSILPYVNKKSFR